jgi:NitT/TauT family transport system substrate-binding protein
MTVSRTSFLAGGCAAGLVSIGLPARAQQRSSVRLAAVPIDASGEAYYASDLGYFKEAGLDVDLVSMVNGGVIAPAVSSGSIDIGSSNIVSLATAHERGIPFVVVAPAGMYTSKTTNMGVIVAKGSPITTAAALSGKTVAVDSLKGIAYVTFAAWVDKSGGNLSAIKFIELQMAEQPAALSVGRVDAGVVAEPFLTNALDTSSLLTKLGDDVAHAFLIGAYFTTLAYAQAHPDVVRAFANVIIKTGRWANTHGPEAQTILQKYSKTKPIAGMLHTVYPDRFDVGIAQPLIDAAAKYGVLNKSFPVAEMTAPGLAAIPKPIS